MPQIESAYVDTGKVRYLFRAVFIDQYPETRLAVEALYCAGEQGKFWEMHDWLYTNAEDWPYAHDVAQFLAQQAAPKLGLDGAALETCLRQERYRSRVEGLQKRMAARGIDRTPSFLINGRLVSGAQPFDEFRRIIEEELAK